MRSSVAQCGGGHPDPEDSIRRHRISPGHGRDLRPHLLGPLLDQSRRDFLKTTALISGALAGPAVLPGRLFAAPGDVLRVGLVGCGGRGSGTASQALKADPNVVLTAMGDAFNEPLQNSLKSLKQQFGDKVKVTPETAFVGLDAYQNVIKNSDVVLLPTPPGFRPVHLKAAIDAGKHVFCEKPMATDAPGVRSVLESVKAAEAKKLALVAGFCWRYDAPRREFYKRIHDVAIGEIVAIQEICNTGSLRSLPRRPGMTEMEYQLYNWYDFNWLSAALPGLNVVHNVDKASWAMHDEPPVKVWGMGGRVASTALAARKAGIDPGGIEVAELHAPFTHQELILREALGLPHAVRINPSGGALAANPMMSAGLVRIGEAAAQVRSGRARRALAHATQGHCLQQNLVCWLEGELWPNAAR